MAVLALSSSFAVHHLHILSVGKMGNCDAQHTYHQSNFSVVKTRQAGVIPPCRVSTNEKDALMICVLSITAAHVANETDVEMVDSKGIKPL